MAWQRGFLRRTPAGAASPAPSGSQLGTLEVTAPARGGDSGAGPGVTAAAELLQLKCCCWSLVLTPTAPLPARGCWGHAASPKGWGQPRRRATSPGAVGLVRAGLGENPEAERGFLVDVGLPSSPGGGNVRGVRAQRAAGGTVSPPRGGTAGAWGQGQPQDVCWSHTDLQWLTRRGFGKGQTPCLGV